MYRSRNFPLVLLVAINFLLNSPANAGVVKRSVRMVREVYPPDVEPENEGNQPQVCIVGDVVYGAEEPVPAEQPCLKCRCQPPGVQCETVQCAKKPGCKAIHRSTRCCPDYQCECEHNGKIYANGEKLEANPGSECKVCYCRGGEIQCAEVSCYIRKDCEGKRVPGTCCPRYDNCPPIDALPDRTYLTTESPLNTLKPVVLELWQESTNSTDLPSVPTLNNTPEDSNKVPDTSDSVTVPPSFQEIPKKEEGMLPRITIQEIIPERKEIPVTAPPKIFISNPQGTLLIEEALPTIENTSNDLNADSEPDSSEISEVFQHPPPILRIGDKLLFLKKGELVPEKDTSTSQSVITIIGAEGLQRGGVEESLEVHEVKIQPENDAQEIKNEENDNVKFDSKLDMDNLDAQNSKNNPDGNTKIQNNFHLDDLTHGTETNDLELKTSESTHILSLVKKKHKGGSAVITSTTQEPTTAKEEVLTTPTSSIEEPVLIQTLNILTESSHVSETTEIPISNKPKDLESNSDSTTLLPLPDPTTQPDTKQTDPVSEQNPAYPPLPDVMSAVGDGSHKYEIELENDNATTMEIKILPEVYDFLSNKTKNQTHNSEWLKVNTNNESLVNFKAAKLPDELLNQKSPLDEEEEIGTDATETTTFVYQTSNIAEVGTKLLENHTIINESVADGSPLEKQVFSLKAQPILPEEEHQKLVEKSKSEEKKVKKDKLEEEGAQLIAEVRISEDLSEFDQSTSNILTLPTNRAKTLTPIKKETDENNKSFMAETIEPLKEGDTSIKPNKSQVELVRSSDQSVESLEVDSGEVTTPKTNHSAMVSNENASIEKVEKEGNLETNDMVLVAEKEGSIELGSVELPETSTMSVLADVEMIEASTKSLDISVNQTNSGNAAKKDVELINVMNIPKPTKIDKVESSTYELLPTPEEAKAKSIRKREVASKDPQDDIFKDLEKELDAESASFNNKSPHEEKSEADGIFKELLDETKGLKVDTKPKNKEQEKVEDISNLLAGIVLKGNAPDPKVFRLIGGLFRGQRK